MKNRNPLLKMILAALFLALSYGLPFLTGQLQVVGSMLCPMHLPVFFCGFLCGGMWGAVVGVAAPLLRSVTLGMPVLFPSAVCMALELAAYGVVAGRMYQRLRRKKAAVAITLCSAMGIGRVIWGIAMAIALGLTGKSFSFYAFLSGAVIHAVPGIILQLLLIPPLVPLLERWMKL